MSATMDPGRAPDPARTQDPAHAQDPARSPDASWTLEAGRAPDVARTPGLGRTQDPAHAQGPAHAPDPARIQNPGRTPVTGRTQPSPPAPIRFGYGTNGLTDLRLDDALSLLADLGYDGVGLTLDHMHLDPLAPELGARTARVARRLEQLGLGVTVETGARYVLDPRRKHGPSLIAPDPEGRAARAELLITAVRVAADLGAHAVHCFSGITPEGTSPETAWKRLAESMAPVLDAAAKAGVPLAVEPEPGHLLATLADFHQLRRTLGDPDPQLLGLTLDIGHCQCLEPASPADCVREAAPWLRHVQIEDMRRGVHEHLPFGDGEIDFPPILRALAETGYQGLTVVELPRHSHAGPDQAERSLHFLRRAEAEARTAAAAAAGAAAIADSGISSTTAAHTEPAPATAAAPTAHHPATTPSPSAEPAPATTPAPSPEPAPATAAAPSAEPRPAAAPTPHPHPEPHPARPAAPAGGATC